jgi:hypothetical protein
MHIDHYQEQHSNHEEEEEEEEEDPTEMRAKFDKIINKVT